MNAPTHPYRVLKPHGDTDPRENADEFRGLCALVVMAKAPVPGRVKTRLCPPLTPEECAEINSCFLRDTVENLSLATLEAPAKWAISYTPVGEERAFIGILPPSALLLPQRGDGFGERLLTTAEDLFACGFSAVCLIDSDSPTVPTAEFAQAARALLAGEDRIVLGCSEDGGYYLIGMNTPQPVLFERISWSTESVAEETLARIAEIGLPSTLLETWYDVDDAASLDMLLAEFSGRRQAGYRAPHTRAYLKAMHESMEDAMEQARPIQLEEAGR